MYHRCLSGTLVSEQSVAHTRPHSHAVKSSRHPRRNEATIVGRRCDGKRMATWCSIWVQVWKRECGPRIPTSPILQLRRVFAAQKLGHEYTNARSTVSHPQAFTGCPTDQRFHPFSLRLPQSDDGKVLQRSAQNGTGAQGQMHLRSHARQPQ